MEEIVQDHLIQCKNDKYSTYGNIAFNAELLPEHMNLGIMLYKYQYDFFPSGLQH